MVANLTLVGFIYLFFLSSSCVILCLQIKFQETNRAKSERKVKTTPVDEMHVTQAEDLCHSSTQLCMMFDKFS